MRTHVAWCITALLLVSGLAISGPATNTPVVAKKEIAQGEFGFSKELKEAPTFRISCFYHGTENTGPSTMSLMNHGPELVPKGTRAHWWIPTTSYKGNYVFAKDLQPMGIALVNVQFGGDMKWGLKCNVTVIKVKATLRKAVPINVPTPVPPR